MASFIIIIFIIVFSLLPLSSPIPDETLLNAADILSNSGYISMSLTLGLVAKTLISASPSATIFSPSDDAFSLYGQPSLTLLQFHFCPIAYSLSDLRSVPFGTEVSTLFPNRSLIITSLPSDYEISINDVMIKGSPIFDDGVLVILGIDKFIDLNFKIGAPVAGSPSDGPRPSSNLECPVSYWDLYPFSEASESLRSRGYSIMASFLDLQLMQFDVEHTQFTVFAPMDEAMQGHIGNSIEWASVFLRHIVPCKLPMADLSRLDDGTLLRTFLGGFLINVTHSGDNLLLNDVPVVLPNMYQSDHVVVHGLGAILLTPEKQEEEELGNSPEYGAVAEEVILDEF